MKKIDEITSAIKIEIRNRIVGQSFKYKGQLKEIKKFDKYWNPGFEILEEFDLASIPIDGPTEVNIKFSCWAIQDVDGNSKRNAQINGRFGPIIIAFELGEYTIDPSKAEFSLIEVN